MLEDAEPPLPRNVWYPIASARHVRKRPRTVQRLGRSVVLWRNGAGELVAHDALCPHRGADLGLGIVIAGELSCPYHGFRFGTDGECTAMPCEPEGKPSRRDLSIRRYEVREHRGLVWLWHGDVAADLPPLPWFEELPETDRHAWDHETVWPLPQLRVMEGMLDMHHVPFAHGRYLRGIGTWLDPYEVKVEGDTVRTFGTLRRHGDGPKRGFRARIDARLPGLLLLRFGARLWAFVACTPVSREATWIFARYFVEVPVVGKLLAALSLGTEFALVQPDDRRMLLSTSPRTPDVRDHKLVRADLGIAQWHKLFSRAVGDKRRDKPATSPASSGTEP
ncbi:Rieske 2Fe-2S domain-containing protein [Polyangium jinanense]|uniref:Rieske 2Fe-2S domain-containing protein n=1 Tax=Polyangium jinanense TaxID=2829994 RepID=A0A9X3X3T2_9BACT|nr:Rieske 2Fe-2S domain-containing protein [Polyangium jinanense]MDC3981748.1 Rieske 2Fe-2S domain-containing protein [Polyangium jinanense]